MIRTGRVEWHDLLDIEKADNACDAYAVDRRCQLVYSLVENAATYKLPSRKIPKTPIFLLLLNRSFHTTGMGNVRISILVKTCSDCEKYMSASPSMHFPLPFLVQKKEIGRHWKMVVMVPEMKKPMQTAAMA